MYDEMISAVKNTSVVAVGPRTEKELRSFGIRAAHMPENYSSIGLGEMFTSMSSEGKKIIMPRSSASKSFLKELLEKNWDACARGSYIRGARCIRYVRVG